ncbi:unnamed protein product [Darwinula stevensoni]|uniref:Fibronectin type-III domain-containing protein n=1 Tax=Darwinula stevensoni TaxID=69355 RepID=A0A7R8X3W7_9CRUS|nr:unnamed protein product [Darwinula stevensoni]CAG0878966.1 unnamed protein product [Darwinula stevensoni]
MVRIEASRADRCKFYPIAGSAKYLEDRKKSSRQARVTLRCKSSSRLETLDVKELGSVEQAEKLCWDGVTHVVSGIQYGVEGFMVFDREVSSEETVREVEESLKIVLDEFKANGAEPFAAKDDEAHRFLCTYHGDISLAKNPTTFMEGLRAHEDVTILSRKVSVPKRAYLTPLHELDDRAVQLMWEVSPEIVGKAEAIFEALHDLKVRTNDLVGSKAYEHFSGIRAQMDTFRSLVDRFKTDFQESIVPLIMSIRLYGSEETSISQLMQQKMALIYGGKELLNWLTEKETEIRMLGDFLGSFEGVTFAFAPVELSNVLNDKEIANTVCFVFRASPKTDICLERVSQYLKRKGTDSSSPQNETPKSWYKDKDIMMSLEADAKNFMHSFEANKSQKHLKFVVTEDHLREKSHDIILYEGGTPRRFVPPGKPGIPKVLEVTHDTVLLSWDSPTYGSESVEGYLVWWRPFESEDSWHRVEVNGKVESITIPGLNPNSKIVCKVQSRCSIGTSEESGESKCIQTLPLDSARHTPELLEGFQSIKELKSGWMSTHTLISTQEYQNDLPLSPPVLEPREEESMFKELSAI